MDPGHVPHGKVVLFNLARLLSHIPDLHSICKDIRNQSLHFNDKTLSRHTVLSESPVSGLCLSSSVVASVWLRTVVVVVVTWVSGGQRWLRVSSTRGCSLDEAGRQCWNLFRRCSVSRVSLRRCRGEITYGESLNERAHRSGECSLRDVHSRGGDVRDADGDVLVLRSCNWACDGGRGQEGEHGDQLHVCWSLRIFD